MTSTERIPLEELLESADAPGRLEKLAGELRQGKIMAYPTDTIYGLGGVVADTVRKRIVAAKQRAPDHPMLWIASSREIIVSSGCVFSPAAVSLADRFWPGRLTLIVGNSRGQATGVRVSDHPFIVALGALLPRPLFSTSANVSGSRYINDPNYIYSIFDGAVDYLIDAGPLPESKPSTVVDVSAAGEVRIIREGAVGASEIQAVFGSW